MTSTVDVRDAASEDVRDAVFDALSGAEAGETVVVTADRDLFPVVCLYRVRRDPGVTWEGERTEDTWEVRATPSDEEVADSHPEVDVRELPPQRRHAVLTETFEGLDPGEGFVLVNDHDPKPLFYELRSTHGDVVGWEYVERGADAWRVEIEKTGASAADESDTAATFDVREIPKQDRHASIHHRYGNLSPGEALDVVAPHEPRPLRREFEDRYGDDFDWTVLENDPGRCRVRVTKRDGGSAAESADELDVTAELDVRDRPPAERHERIYEAYEALDEGEAFVLVNDHDPKPLYHQFQAEAGPEFHWAYEQKSPGEFRVVIGKRAEAEEGAEVGEVDAPF